MRLAAPAAIFHLAFAAGAMPLVSQLTKDSAPAVAMAVARPAAKLAMRRLEGFMRWEDEILTGGGQAKSSGGR